jgi:hypothetical protein
MIRAFRLCQKGVQMRGFQNLPLGQHQDGAAEEEHLAPGEASGEA